ncbi:MAG: DUF3106 domain-containing protein [Proteobacteria bacterium]|nr:DUF3106 domain-containing protein [Burkholderiales bacterium]
MAEASGRAAAVARARRRPARSLRAHPVIAGALLLCALVGAAGHDAWAQSSPPPAPARQSSWAQLPPEQKQFLAPLADQWDSLSSQTRRKLVGIAQRQQTMSPEQKERVQSRLTQWASLSAEERELARKNYQQLKTLPPDQRQSLARRWHEAQQAGVPAEAVPNSSFGAPGGTPSSAVGGPGEGASGTGVEPAALR